MIKDAAATKRRRGRAGFGRRMRPATYALQPMMKTGGQDVVGGREQTSLQSGSDDGHRDFQYKNNA